MRSTVPHTGHSAAAGAHLRCGGTGPPLSGYTMDSREWGAAPSPGNLLGKGHRVSMETGRTAGSLGVQGDGGTATSGLRRARALKGE